MANKKGLLRVAPEKKLRVCVTFRITAGEYKYLESRGLNVNVLAASLLRRHIEAAKRADQRKQVVAPATGFYDSLVDACVKRELEK